MEPEKYSAKWVESEVRRRGARNLKVHNCSMCGYPCGYLFGADDDLPPVVYDSGCDCTRGYSYCPSSYEDVAALLRMQSSDEIREKLMSGMA